MAPTTKTILSTALRSLAYLVVVAGVAQFLLIDAEMSSQGQLFSEFTGTEMLQMIMLGISVLLLVIASWWLSGARSLLLVMALLLFAAMIRELDFWLDDHVFDGAWQLIVSVLLALVIVIVLRAREEFIRALNDMLRSPGFGILLAGALALLVFSRLFGRAIFWEAVMREDYFRAVKNAAEEGTELLGYTLIALGVVEVLVFFFHRKKSLQS